MARISVWVHSSSTISVRPWLKRLRNLLMCNPRLPTGSTIRIYVQSSIKSYTSVFERLATLPSTIRIDNIDPAIIPFLLVVKARRQIDRVLVLHQSRLLHKTLILRIKYIVHKVVFQQATHPDISHQQADIPHRDCEDVERSCTNDSNRKCQQPPIEEE